MAVVMSYMYRSLDRRGQMCVESNVFLLGMALEAGVRRCFQRE